MTNPIDRLADEIAGKNRASGKSLHWLEYLQRQIQEAGYDEDQAEQILKWCNKAYWAGRRGKRRS